MGEHDRQLALALERPLAREALEQHAAERVDVDSSVDRLPADLLRRDVVDRADEPAVAGEAADRRDVPREAEVADIRLLAVRPVRHEDVPGLHVTMDEPGRVRRVERLAHLLRKADGASGLEPSLASQELAQVDAVDIGHREVEDFAVLAGRDRLDDMRMVERRSEMRLPQEPLPEALVMDELGREQLQRDTLAVVVLREIDDPHRPPRKLLADPESSDDAARGAVDAHRSPQSSQRPSRISTSRLRLARPERHGRALRGFN